VSGGGYIGGWLTSWISRKTASVGETWEAGVERLMVCLKTGRDLWEAERIDKTDNEPAPIRHLRAYSRYLSPRSGVFSADTWTLGAAYLRNLLLTWLVLLPGIATIVTIPLVAAALVRQVASGSAHPLWLLPVLVVVGSVSGALAVRFVHRYRPDARLDPLDPRRRPGQKKFLVACLLPFILSGAALTTAWVWMSALDLSVIEPVRKSMYGLLQAVIPATALPQWATASDIRDVDLSRLQWIFIAPATVLGALIHLVGWLSAGRFQHDKWRARIGEGVVVVSAGALCAYLVALIAWHASPWPNVWKIGTHDELFATVGLPIYCTLLVLATDLHLGVISHRQHRADDSEREWSARFNGWILAMAITWLVFSTLAVLAPHWLGRLSPNWASWSSLVTVLSGAAAAWLGRSRSTGGTAGSMASTFMGALKELPRKATLTIAMAAFCAALVVAMTLLNAGTIWLVACKMASAAFCGSPQSGTRSAVELLDLAPWVWPLLVGVLMAAAALLFGSLIDMNKFSLHGLYRLRLIRAYLGASRNVEERKPDPFMGFDDKDNLNMRELRAPPAARGERRLFHVVNVALNLVRGAQLAWQDRKAESFTISPLHAGSHRVCYRRTSPTPRQEALEQRISAVDDSVLSPVEKQQLSPRYYGGEDGVSLGTAIAISGAAASPNMGYHSSALVTFVMTLFNARLGWWLANPGKAGDKVFDRTSPTSSLLTIWEELIGATNDKNSFVYLSDGGHFENLGLYEMVLRRNRFILVSDASADPECSLADLGNAIRQIRADFRIPITFSPDFFAIRKRGSDPDKEHAYWAVGRIGYSAVDAPVEMPTAEAEQKYDGILLYIKPCFYGNEPRDVYNYAQESIAFPHEPTADQFFSEAQFESYRALGEYVIDSACDALAVDDMFAGVYPASIPAKVEPFGKKPSPSPSPLQSFGEH